MNLLAISLAEAVKLKSILTKKIQELLNEMNTVSHVIVEKGEEPKQPEHSLQKIETELADIRKDSRTLDALIYRANIDNSVTFKGETLAIVEAIELATQLRAEAAHCKQLGQSEKESFFHSSGETILYRVAMFEPSEYRKRANELEKEAHRLSNAINAVNYQIQLDFDDMKYF